MLFIEDINLGIEYDGAYHHKKKTLLDSQKNIFLKNNLIKLIRVRRTPLNKLSDNDVLVYQDELKKKDLDNICYSILNFCDDAAFTEGEKHSDNTDTQTPIERF